MHAFHNDPAHYRPHHRLTPIQRELIAKSAAEIHAELRRPLRRERAEAWLLGLLTLASATFVFYGWAVLIAVIS